MTPVERRQNDYINQKITETLAELRRHLHDPFTGVCPTCDVPGPCPTSVRLTERAETLEAMQDRLIHGDEEEGDLVAATA